MLWSSEVWSGDSKNHEYCAGSNCLLVWHTFSKSPRECRKRNRMNLLEKRFLGLRKILCVCLCQQSSSAKKAATEPIVRESTCKARTPHGSDSWIPRPEVPDKHHCSRNQSLLSILCRAIPLLTLRPFSAESIATRPLPLDFPTICWIRRWIRHFYCHIQQQSIGQFESLPAWDKLFFLAPISVSNGHRSVHFLPPNFRPIFSFPMVHRLEHQPPVALSIRDQRSSSRSKLRSALEKQFGTKKLEEFEFGTDQSNGVVE